MRIVIGIVSCILVVLSPLTAKAVESIGCDAPPAGLHRNPFPVVLTFSNQTDQTLFAVAGQNAQGYAGKDWSHEIRPGESRAVETLAGAQWFITNKEGRCVEQVRSLSDDVVGLAMTSSSSKPSVQRQVQSASYCNDNPGVCILGLFLGVAAVGMMTSGGDTSGSSPAPAYKPVCREQYLGNDHMGAPIYITRCE